MDAIYRQVAEELDAKRWRQREQLERRQAEAARLCPALAGLLRRRRQLLFAAPPPGLGFEAALEDARRELRQTNADICAALAAAGLPEDALELQFDCPHCRDTGWETGAVRHCRCYTRRAAQLVCETLQSQRPRSTFAAFDLDCFDDSLQPGERYSQRERMDKAREALMRWCERFPRNPLPHLFLQGKVGLGKTFLCGCIAQALERAGQAVLYLTAYQMVESVTRSFSEKEKTRGLQRYLLPDVVILDDLGSEPMYNNVTIETLFFIVNERLLAGAPLVLATNLTNNELKQRYGERLTSRILDATQFARLVLSGKDVRLYRGE